ncbi:DUF3108 domain-containing protein [Rhodoferax sp.]|uniref:DUF3108 domain-containing protein n=1 Tax=Rhodoferax sp. TaxID=50421 RepID=UPI00260D5DE0|nr:DUF3108 domain-containing protein [Rhodoferax sp.]MDD2925990.1 DUF3108 domain-containing protein [Rhodoferax sp.]
MDAFKTRSPLRRWLVLGLVVLLVHLGLLQSMPLALNPASQRGDAALTFTTRTITPLPDPLPVVPARVVPAQPKPPLPRAAAPKPVVPPPPAPTPETAADSTAVTTGLSAMSEQLAAARAADAASTPEATRPPPEPPAEPPAAPRPPRERPPSFSLDALTGSTRLLYKIQANKFPYNLNGELLWRHLGTSYNARLSFSAFGQSRSQTSRGQITDVGLAPERFSDKYRSEVAAHFNYTQGKVTFSANTPDAPLLVGAQDRLSVLLQLGALVASEPERYGPGTTLTVQTVGPRDADLWLFTFEGSETLELPGGTLQGLKLVRNPRQPYDQKVEVWLAPQLGYLPARIRITETNGDSIDQQWSATQPADSPD